MKSGITQLVETLNSTLVKSIDELNQSVQHAEGKQQSTIRCRLEEQSWLIEQLSQEIEAMSEHGSESAALWELQNVNAQLVRCIEMAYTRLVHVEQQFHALEENQHRMEAKFMSILSDQNEFAQGKLERIKARMENAKRSISKHCRKK